jgi:hypothetical protein
MTAQEDTPRSIRIQASPAAVKTLRHAERGLSLSHGRPRGFVLGKLFKKKCLAVKRMLGFYEQTEPLSLPIGFP